MTPFNVEMYLKGQPVITRSGIPVETLREIGFKEIQEKCLAGVVNNIPRVWNIEGVYISGTDVNMDLFMSEPVVYYWVLTKEIINTDPQDPAYSQIKIIA